mgnify:CR=1 FL=1
MENIMPLTFPFKTKPVEPFKTKHEFREIFRPSQSNLIIFGIFVAT